MFGYALQELAIPSPKISLDGICFSDMASTSVNSVARSELLAQGNGNGGPLRGPRRNEYERDAGVLGSLMYLWMSRCVSGSVDSHGCNFTETAFPSSVES